MNMLISINELTNYKSNDLIPFQCVFCNITFYRPKNEVQRFLKGNYHGTMKFCSRKCSGLFSKKREMVKCAYCENIFSKKRSEILNSKNDFCTQSCNAKYQNSHKTHGFRRSKAELLIETYIKNDFPHQKILTSDRLILKNGLEIDIHLPEIKIAIEINGLVHYQPIYGQDKYNKIIENDIKKITLLEEMNYSVIILDISKCTSWNLALPMLKNAYDVNIKPIIIGKEGSGVKPQAIFHARVA